MSNPNSNVQSNGKVQTPAPANLVQPIARPRNTELSAEIEAELAQLRAENARLVAEAASKPKGKNTLVGDGLSVKISEKGALSVYGLGRFPVTLYREQFERLLAAAEDIRAFIKANGDKLKTKEQSKAEKAAAKA